MAKQMDSHSAGAEVPVTPDNQQMVAILLQLLKDAQLQQRARPFTVDDLPDDVKQDISLAADTFAFIDAGLRLAQHITVSPTSGSPNVRVRISGANFVAPATVNFGGKAATNVNVCSSTEIDATAPAHDAGAVVDIEVTTAGGPSRLSKAFTYDQ